MQAIAHSLFRSTAEGYPPAGACRAYGWSTGSVASLSAHPVVYTRNR